MQKTNLPKRCLTIVVPTLWKAKTFPGMVTSLAESAVVSQVIIIDNDPSRAPQLSHPAIKTITKGSNIFVNPAWNWGVKNSTSRFTCLLNDDIDATGDLLEYAVSILNADSDRKFLAPKIVHTS